FRSSKECRPPGRVRHRGKVCVRSLLEPARPCLLLQHGCAPLSSHPNEVEGRVLDVAYIVAPVLLIAVVLAAVWLERFSVPVILVALGAGIVFGSDVLNLWAFDDVILTNQVANMALVFILFHGGFVTKL